MEKISIKQTCGAFVVALVVVVAVMYSRTVTEAHVFLSTAQQELAVGHESEAMQALRKALSWNSPLNHYSAQAENLLHEMAFDSGRTSDTRVAALRELERGMRSGRSWLFPRSADSAEVAEVRAELDRLVPAEGPGRIEAVANPEPNFFYQGLAQVLFWGWIFSVISCIFTGFRPDGQLVTERAAPIALISGIVFVLWLVALSQA